MHPTAHRLDITALQTQTTSHRINSRNELLYQLGKYAANGPALLSEVWGPPAVSDGDGQACCSAHIPSLDGHGLHASVCMCVGGVGMDGSGNCIGGFLGYALRCAAMDM